VAQVDDVNGAGAKAGNVRAGPGETASRELTEDLVLVLQAVVTPYERRGAYGEKNSRTVNGRS